jgi:hypothetical protein
MGFKVIGIGPNLNLADTHGFFIITVPEFLESIAPLLGIYQGGKQKSQKQ